MSKKSIRFFNDREVRAVWNDESKFLDWFTYSDNTIDGKSRKKAYTLFESGLLNSLEAGSMISGTLRRS